MQLFSIALTPIAFLLFASCLLIDACATFRPQPAVVEQPTDVSAVSWKQIEWSIDACRKNGGVRTIFISGKTVCQNGGRFLPPKNKASK